MGRARRFLALGLFATLLAPAQPRPASISPAPPEPAARRPVSRPLRGWWFWPGPWFAQREDRPLPPPVQSEPPARSWVVNPDWQPPRFQPSLTHYADGALPAAAPPPSSARLSPCLLVLSSGERLPARWCEWRDDTVRYEDESGRRIRVSLDLVDRRASTRPD